MLRPKALTAALAATVTLVVIMAAAAPAGAKARPPLPVPYGAAALLQFAIHEVLAPTAVAGANDGCRPSAAHPYPVVLVHGTFADEGSNWVTLAPLLANSGYCVYALNYGESLLSLGNHIDGINYIQASARQLRAFINHVLAQTGATQVDIVGHSQGGMMPNYYIKFLGGAAKVHRLIGLAPSNHGTTVDGIVTLLNVLPGVGKLVDGLVALLGAPAVPQQLVGSRLMARLFAGGDTVPGPRYVVVETTHDEVVTPYTHAFLHGPGVTDVTVQDQCPSDPTGHVGLFDDSPALQNVLNQLQPVPNPAFRAACTNFGVGF